MRKNLSKKSNITDKGTIVKIPDVTGEIMKLVLKSYKDGMNSNGKQERGQWVTLLDATRGQHKGITEFQPRWLAVAELDPPEKLWKMVGNLPNNRGPVEGVKGVFQIDLENSQRSSVIHGSNEPVQRVRNGFTSTRNAYSDLKRNEQRGGFLARKTTKALGNKSAQDLYNCYGSYATIFFLQRKKTGSA